MDTNLFQNTIESGLKKSRMMENYLGPYFLKSILAGLYLGIVVFIFWNLNQNLAGSPFGKVIASLFFGVGLYIIVITGAELFTGNNMFMTLSSLSKKTSWIQTLKLWVVCYAGNLVGSIAIALLLLGANSYAALQPEHALFTGALAKAKLPAAVIFFRGVLANWIVCLAIWVGLHVREDITKFASIVAIVFMFLYLGFEHSIANMATFSMAILGGGALTVADAGYNLLWATLGNIVGGGGLMGIVYWLVNRRFMA